jgi:DNA-binding MarR family transcriptional regulator
VSDPVTNRKATGERWAKLAARAVADPNLKARTVRVLTAIGIHADRDGTAWPSQETLGTIVGVRRETVCRDVKQLLQSGYLDRYRKPTTRGRFRNVYRLLYRPYASPHGERASPES